MRKLLITGRNGFIGKHLNKLLRSKSFEIINSSDIDAVNLCEWTQVKELSKVETIIHLASKNFIPESFNEPLSYYKNNILSTLNILEKAKIDGSKVIFFSTYVYGQPQYLPIDENHIKNPLNPYTQSKLISEELCNAYNRDFGIPITIFRPFNIYGPGQNSAFFIPTIINQINNEHIELNDSSPKRDFIHIDDVVGAVYNSILSNELSFETYNIGTGISTSVGDIVKMIINLSNSKARVIFSDQIRQGEILDTVADISKIKKNLNWEPTISIPEGIEIIVKGELTN